MRHLINLLQNTFRRSDGDGFASRFFRGPTENGAVWPQFGMDNAF